MMYEYYMLAGCFVGCGVVADYLTSLVHCWVLQSGADADGKILTFAIRQNRSVYVDISFQLDQVEQQSTSTKYSRDTTREW
jgi:hypothetical protein